MVAVAELIRIVGLRRNMVSGQHNDIKLTFLIQSMMATEIHGNLVIINSNKGVDDNDDEGELGGKGELVGRQPRSSNKRMIPQSVSG